MIDASSAPPSPGRPLTLVLALAAVGGRRGLAQRPAARRLPRPRRRRSSTSSCRTRRWAPRSWRPAIAIPMEVALAGLPDVRRIRSTSQLGVAQVTSRVRAGRRLLPLPPVRGRAGRRRRPRELPPGTDAPLVSSLTGRLNEIFEFTLEAEPGAADLMAPARPGGVRGEEPPARRARASRPSSGWAATCGSSRCSSTPTAWRRAAITLDEVLHAVRAAPT